MFTDYFLIFSAVQLNASGWNLNIRIYKFIFQQALLSLSGNLTISLLVAEVVCAENDEEMKAKLLGTTLFMSGITTLMMIFVGVRLPLFQGAAGDYVIPLLVLVAVDPNRCVVDPETREHIIFIFN